MLSDNFRFLVERRGLRDYQILHHVRYSSKKWLGGWIGPLLERRHRLQQSEDATAEHALAVGLLKLTANSFYVGESGGWQQQQ